MPIQKDKVYQFAALSDYSFQKRILIRLADLIFFGLIKILGGSTRFEVRGSVHLDTIRSHGKLPIVCFWHDRIFLGTYFFRDQGIVVMTSQSFDGEYIARFIKRFGYGAARGSSTRGGTGAIVEMVRLMRAGHPTAFTIDGPKGPRYVAKMGAVLLAKKTGQPIVPFTITTAKHWEAKSWDGFQVPFPFTTARVEIAPPIYVTADADDETLSAKRDELQNALDKITRNGEQWRSGSF